MMEALKNQLAEGHSVVDNYVLMQAAVPAHCYDTTNTLDYSRFTTAPNYTPDAYRGYPGAINNGIQGSMVNFFNANDFALATGTMVVFGKTNEVNWDIQRIGYQAIFCPNPRSIPLGWRNLLSNCFRPN